jgi:hypothetical protein
MHSFINNINIIDSYLLSGTSNASKRLDKTERRDRTMLAKMNGIRIGLIVALFTLVATPAFARGISFKDGGVALWIFVAIGAIIVLLQLIPAGILFVSMIGTATTVALRRGKKVEEEIVLPEMKPVRVKK